MSDAAVAVGRRDRQIAIEACTDAIGTTRFPVEDWVPLVSLWAGESVTSGDEHFSADQLSGTADAIWTIGYRADCDPDLVDVVKLRRIRRNGRLYDIVGASLLDQRQGIALRTRAKVG
jgi:SPP1 family predicted phage head-tail adaptor